MCGICGKLLFDGSAASQDGELSEMSDRLSHRGPDGQGDYFDGPVGLAHRRLSVIDIEGSAQPLSNEDGTIWVTYNGEIYNFQSLRDELIERGHEFRTAGDTEVLVHLYEEYGCECVSRLRGMFAFAIWDGTRQELFLARDRLGIKPLYYFSDANRLVFASEIKAILADPYCRERKAVDLHALDAYFSFLCVPAPRTIYRGIRKLLPGHFMTVSERGEVRTTRYWDVQFGTEPYRMDEGEVSERLLALLRESVELRMVSDVPLGAFLSGGMDSSAVVAMMAGLSERPVKTFSVGFEEDGFDEAKDAARVARCFGTDHTEVILSAPDIMDEMMDLLEHFDEPYADSSLLPTFVISRVARRSVTVALSGDGGDELFGGYPWWHQRPPYQLHLSRLPRLARSLLASAARRCGGRVPKGYFLSRLDQPYEQYLLNAKAVFDDAARESVYSEEFRGQLRGSSPHAVSLKYLERSGRRSWTDRLMEHDLKTYLPDDILTKVDMMSMRCSLETRVPLLDHRMVEFASRVPASMKYAGGVHKHILKKALADVLPERILKKKKQGFSIPLATWLRTSMLECLTDTLHSTPQHGFFERPAVEQMLDDFVSGDNSITERIWELFVFEHWHQRQFT